MSRIKFCGLCRPQDIDAANRQLPDYAGFVFAKKSRRYLPPETAAKLKARLNPGITAVGVFVDEDPELVAALLSQGIIGMAQLHGKEDASYIAALRSRTSRPLLQAFRIRSKKDLAMAAASPADHILLDAGAGEGKRFDWKILEGFQRPYFLAGGLNAENVGAAIRLLRPFAVDVSSGLETDGQKDPVKMEAFARAAREAIENIL